MAVLWRGHDLPVEVGGPELCHVIDHDEVTIEVDQALDPPGQGLGEVDPRVVQGLVERLADGP